MIEFGITVVLVVLLVVVFLSKRKKCSPCCSTAKNKQAPEQVNQQPETAPSEKPIVKTEPTAVNPQITDATVVSSPEPKKPEPSAQPQTKAAAFAPGQNDSSAVPQDSILKRHYLRHICTMLETLSPVRPTDSVLCRHYDALLVAKLEQCLNDKKAMQQLVGDYEKRSA